MAIVWGAHVQGANAQGLVVRGAIVRGAIVQGGHCPGTMNEFLFPPYQINFFLVFNQATDQKTFS